MNVGALSNIISGKRSISVKQLDQITAGMGLDEGYFYSFYITEIFDQEIMDWRKIKPLLKRCADLHRLEEIHRIVQLTLDNLTYIPLLFDIAELFFNEGKNDAAILLYKGIAESERSQHSERLALCQYRMFCLQLNDDQEHNLILATQFETYVERLNEDYQLDAINKLLNINISLCKWDKVELNAHKLLNKALKQYNMFGSNNSDRKTNNPLIFYILYAYLELGDAYFHLKQHSKALEYVQMYADATWVTSPDEEDKHIIEQFESWAVGNRYVYQLMAGQIDVMPEYINYMTTNENEISMGIYTIIIVANEYKINIDNILNRFSDYLQIKNYETLFSKTNQQVTSNQNADFSRQLAIYYLNNGQLDTGIRYIIDSLEYAIKINNNNTKIKCLTAIFKISLQHEEYTTNPNFKNLMSDLLEISKKS
ncbi:tetratricopeptide (TPR) repeat protein [Paenibacillus turicensis]|uniref:Tetratricopeptide (TPR) repeat protein n=2 Tax=Paenibacillus turicensis TaxID=160487 RepID=A0ABS4FS67_9BACL|nr:tetratricopeptide (TPR) repeat protein [Paenibacillus turicensis]